MRAIFTEEAVKNLDVEKYWKVIALEIELMFWIKNYAVKISVYDREEKKVVYDYYHTDYLENGKEILDYFLKT